MVASLDQNSMPLYDMMHKQQRKCFEQLPCFLIAFHLHIKSQSTITPVLKVLQECQRGSCEMKQVEFHTKQKLSFLMQLK